jgi:hypothetical protein
MFDLSSGWRIACLLTLTSSLLLGASELALADDKPLKGATSKVDDLKVTELKVPGKATLPCMLWVDPQGSAFMTLEGGTGILRRISYPDCKITKQKDFERKFAWMSLSEVGLLLTEADSEEIWVVDPASLEVKNKIAVPKLKRAVSAPGQKWAVACDRGRPTHDQKLYLVDLAENKAETWAPPTEKAGRIGLDIPEMTPDGTQVFTQGDLVNVHMYREPHAKQHGWNHNQSGLQVRVPGLSHHDYQDAHLPSEHIREAPVRPGAWHGEALSWLSSSAGVPTDGIGVRHQ